MAEKQKRFFWATVGVLISFTYIVLYNSIYLFAKHELGRSLPCHDGTHFLVRLDESQVPLQNVRRTQRTLPHR